MICVAYILSNVTQSRQNTLLLTSKIVWFNFNRKLFSNSRATSHFSSFKRIEHKNSFTFEYSSRATGSDIFPSWHSLLWEKHGNRFISYSWFIDLSLTVASRRSIMPTSTKTLRKIIFSKLFNLIFLSHYSCLVLLLNTSKLTRNWIAWEKYELLQLQSYGFALFFK